MNKTLSLALGALALLGPAAHAAAPSVTGQAEWNFTGTMKGKAHLTCHDPAPAPQPVTQAIPVSITTRDWVAKAKFAADGGFQYWEAAATLKDQPLSKWTAYTGQWTQTGARVVVTLSDKSAAALIGTLDGASKCASSTTATGPCFDTKRYRFTGTAKTTRSGVAQLDLKESVLLGVTTIRAKGQFHCGGLWNYTKAYKSD